MAPVSGVRLMGVTLCLGYNAAHMLHCLPACLLTFRLYLDPASLTLVFKYNFCVLLYFFVSRTDLILVKVKV